MADTKYDIGYVYKNKYGKFQITGIERVGVRWIYIVTCLKCGHVMRKKQQEIKIVRKCLGCVRLMEYSLYNIGDIINGLRVLQKTPTVDKRGYLKKEYLCECIIDQSVVQIREAHLKNGVGCMECAAKKRGELQRKNHDIYIEEMAIKNPCIKIVGTYVDQYTKIKYVCNICGYEGESLPNNLLRGGGCPSCIMSIGEKKIEKYLLDHNIKFKTQYMFEDCRHILRLPFDFYLPDYNMCIEYDGEQHFKPIEFFGGERGFEQRKHNDFIKTQYCKDNNICLYRIGYNQDIIEILNNIFANTFETH